MAISLSVGCLLQEQAILQLTIFPSVIYWGETRWVTMTLKELNGVAVDLNYFAYDDGDEEFILTGQDARNAHLDIFGTSYLTPGRRL